MSKLFGRIHHLSCGVASRWRNIYYRALGVHFDGYAWLKNIDIPRNWSSISIGKGTALDHGVQLLATSNDQNSTLTTSCLRIGNGTYINRYTVIDAHRELRIGDGCMIGPFCYLTDADHDHSMPGPVRQSPMNASSLHIEDGAWIGSHCVLLPGVTIGQNAIIGAGSVVTTDVATNSIALGSPARVIRERV